MGKRLCQIGYAEPSDASMFVKRPPSPANVWAVRVELEFRTKRLSDQFNDYWSAVQQSPQNVN
jgi:hypothetical protein